MKINQILKESSGTPLYILVIGDMHFLSRRDKKDADSLFDTHMKIFSSDAERASYIAKVIIPSYCEYDEDGFEHDEQHQKSIDILMDENPKILDRLASMSTQKIFKFFAEDDLSREARLIDLARPSVLWYYDTTMTDGSTSFDIDWNKL